jgi:flagellar basal-body rod protein FlgB
MVKLFQGETYRALRMGLDACSLRHQVISNNLANIDTPKYQDRVVQFEDQLRSALGETAADGRLVGLRTRPEHIPIGASTLGDVTATVVDSPATSWRVDGNTVDVDLEVTRLMENQAKYRTLARVMADEHRLLRTAITGQGR